MKQIRQSLHSTILHILYHAFIVKDLARHVYLGDYFKVARNCVVLKCKLGYKHNIFLTIFSNYSKVGRRHGCSELLRCLLDTMPQEGNRSQPAPPPSQTDAAARKPFSTLSQGDSSLKRLTVAPTETEATAL